MPIIVLWLIGAALVGIGATKLNRSGGGWFLLALITSPLLAGMILLLIGLGKAETKRRKDQIDPLTAMTTWSRPAAPIVEEIPPPPSKVVGVKPGKAIVVVVLVAIAAALVLGLNTTGHNHLTWPPSLWPKDINKPQQSLIAVPEPDPTAEAEMHTEQSAGSVRLVPLN
jgi:hypothetical protein